VESLSSSLASALPARHRLRSYDCHFGSHAESSLSTHLSLLVQCLKNVLPHPVDFQCFAFAVILLAVQSLSFARRKSFSTPRPFRAPPRLGSDVNDHFLGAMGRQPLKFPEHLYLSPPQTPTSSYSYLSLTSTYTSSAALFQETSSNALAVSDRIPGFKTSAGKHSPRARDQFSMLTQPRSLPQLPPRKHHPRRRLRTHLPHKHT
jgi:hypothetical protein